MSDSPVGKGPIGPAGPSTPSADAGNALTLGSDSLLFYDGAGSVSDATASFSYQIATGVVVAVSAKRETVLYKVSDDGDVSVWVGLYGTGLVDTLGELRYVSFSYTISTAIFNMLAVDVLLPPIAGTEGWDYMSFYHFGGNDFGMYGYNQTGFPIEYNHLLQGYTFDGVNLIAGAVNTVTLSSPPPRPPKMFYKTATYASSQPDVGGAYWLISGTKQVLIPGGANDTLMILDFENVKVWVISVGVGNWTAARTPLWLNEDTGFLVIRTPIAGTRCNTLTFTPPSTDGTVAPTATYIGYTASLGNTGLGFGYMFYDEATDKYLFTTVARTKVLDIPTGTATATLVSEGTLNWANSAANYGLARVNSTNMFYGNSTNVGDNYAGATTGYFDTSGAETLGVYPVQAGGLMTTGYALFPFPGENNNDRYAATGMTDGGVAIMSSACCIGLVAFKVVNPPT